MESRLKMFNPHEEGRRYPSNMFRKAIVAFRLTEPRENGERAAYFSHFEPVFEQDRSPVKGLVNAIAYAQTEHMAPKTPRPDAPAQQQAAAPEQGGASGDEPRDSTYGGFDAGSDDDLMAAAGAAGHGADIGEDIPAQPEPTPPVEQPRPSAGRSRYAARRAA